MPDKLLTLNVEASSILLIIVPLVSRLINGLCLVYECFDCILFIVWCSRFLQQICLKSLLKKFLITKYFRKACLNSRNREKGRTKCLNHLNSFELLVWPVLMLLSCLIRKKLCILFIFLNSLSALKGFLRIHIAVEALL